MCVCVCVYYTVHEHVLYIDTWGEYRHGCYLKYIDIYLHKYI